MKNPFGCTRYTKNDATTPSVAHVALTASVEPNDGGRSACGPHRELIYTGDIFGAERASRLRLVDRDIMGLRAAVQYGVETCSLLDAQGTPEYSTFDDIRRTKGLGEAMKWRDAQFAPFE